MGQCVSASSPCPSGGAIPGRSGALAALVTVAIAVAVVAALAERSWLGLPTRAWLLAASTGFVVLGALAAVATRGLRAVLVLAGLVHCWLGDYLGPHNFTLGGLSFLAGHLWFIAAFALGGLAGRRSGVTAGVLGLAGVAIGAWLLPRVHGGDLALVLGYMAVISLMVAAAAGTRAGAWPFALTGAALFYVSDIAVADGRFVHSGLPHALLCYPLYYSACVMLALWPLAGTRRRGPSDRSAGVAATS